MYYLNVIRGEHVKEMPETLYEVLDHAVKAGIELLTTTGWDVVFVCSDGPRVVIVRDKVHDQILTCTVDTMVHLDDVLFTS